MASSIVESGSDRRPRAYRMGDRAEGVAATRARIVQAAVAGGDPRISLAEVADRAGVSPRTLLRHFGDRNGLFATALETALERIGAQRFAVPAGDVDAAAANLVEHYEEHGDAAIANLALEGSDERVDTVLAHGREMHRRWVAEKLMPLVEAAPASALGRRRQAQLVAVCDVYTWKLLRRDSGLGRAETTAATAELIRGVIGGE